MFEKNRMVRGATWVVAIAGVVVAATSLWWGSRGSGGLLSLDGEGADRAAALRSGSGPGRSGAGAEPPASSEPAVQQPVMPTLNDRIDAMVTQEGIPATARASLAGLGADIRALRERESGSFGGREQREALSAERRVVSTKALDVLEALPPGYRAAMRRHRISARQLATWVAEHPTPADSGAAGKGS